MPQELERSDAERAGAEYGDTLNTVSAEVLETMFFTEAMTIDCEHDWLTSAISARVGFTGSHFGEVFLGVSEPAAVSIASAFLGLDPQETCDLEQSQVVLELANILCGAVLSRLWPDSRLLLDAPELAKWECGLEGGLHCCLALPEGRLSISVRWSETMEAS